jgi:uncharacterized protein
MLEKHYGKLTKGCESCFKGEKLVLFITGICPRDCPYCPLSEERKNRDTVFVNETETTSIQDLIDEVKTSGAKGAGITGGDPLARLARTIQYIKTLKQHFGKEFHIHLYTSLELLDEEKIKKLEEAGLDELRVHPDIFDKTLWHKIELLKETKMETCIEIPAIPKTEKQLFELIQFAKDKVNAFNLNELELAPLHSEEFKKNKWKTDKDSVTIEGSEKTAKNILKKARAWKVRIHFCSARFKDEVQFKGRLKNYAKNIALPCDKITEYGTISHAVIFLDKEKTPNEKKLKELLKSLKEKFPKEFFHLDKEKSRILCSIKIIRTLARTIPNCAIVEEYPTKDKTEIYFEWIS